jgi:Peptidase family M1 domain
MSHLPRPDAARQGTPNFTEENLLARLSLRHSSGFRLRRSLILVLCCLSLCTPLIARAEGTPEAATPTLSGSEAKLYAPVLPEERQEIYAETAGDLSLCKLNATLTPAEVSVPATIAGDLDLTFVNNTGKAQDEIDFRLYPNSSEYAEGAMTLSDVTVSDKPVPPELSVDDTLARLTLSTPVAVDASIPLHVHFITTIPTDPKRSYGMFAYQSATSTYALAHWEPLLAGYDPVAGWNTAPLSINGDPVFTNTALYDVTLTTPQDLAVVTTGSESSHKTIGDHIRHHFVSGPVRDFAMAADSNFESKSQKVGNTTVTSWYNPEHADGGQNVLTWGAQALGIYDELFGEYPYEEMDIVEIDLGNGAGGVEFPGITYIGSDYYGSSVIGDTVVGFLEFVVAHEVAHQWWYGMVGNDQYIHAFMDEGLVNYVTCVYFEKQYSPEVAEQQIDLNLRLPYFSMLFNQGDEIVDQPTDSFPTMDSYGVTIYGKASVGFEAIRTQIGDDAFFGALKAYLLQERFKVAVPEDLLNAFERASGQDLSELWRHWFEAAEGNQDYSYQDYQDLLNRLGL